MTAASQLLVGHYSLRHAPPAERFAAVAAAGFTGISLLWQEVAIRRDQEGLRPLKAQLREAGLTVPQMEVIFLPSAAERAGFITQAIDIATTSANLGCEVVHAVAFMRDVAFEQIAEDFAVLARACANEGLGCGIEFVPYITAVPDLPTAVKLIRMVDLPNTGIVFDAIHFFRSGEHWAELEGLTGADITSVQINDGPIARPIDDYGAESMDLRLLPGTGEFDLHRMLDVLERIGSKAPLTVEVMNRELDAKPTAVAARAMADAARDLLTSHAARPPA